MRQVDEVLDDQELLGTVYEALARRWPQEPHPRPQRHAGRSGAAAAAAQAHPQLELRDPRARGAREPGLSSVHAGGGAESARCQDSGQARHWLSGPRSSRRCISAWWRSRKRRRSSQGRRLRVDTTVVETDIHYPTDSSLLGDGVRVLTRTMKQIAQLAGAAANRLRERTRSVRYRVIEIGAASRSRSEQGKEKLKQSYQKLLCATARVVGASSTLCRRGGQRGQARPPRWWNRRSWRRSRQYLETMIPRVKQVMRQTRERISRATPTSPARS